MPMIVASVTPIKSANKQIKFLTTLTILRACITIILNATVIKTSSGTASGNTPGKEPVCFSDCFLLFEC